MDDLISRRYLIEAFKEEFYYMYSDNFKFMLNWFENLPAVDSFKFCDQLWKIAYEHGKQDAQPATEPGTGLYVFGFNDGYEAGKEDAQQDIVYCKDCRWWGGLNTCGHLDGMVTAPENGFCSYGERKRKEDAQQDIVYCKDCRWWGGLNTCSHLDGMVTAPENGFCSYGERKSDG